MNHSRTWREPNGRTSATYPIGTGFTGFLKTRTIQPILSLLVPPEAGIDHAPPCRLEGERPVKPTQRPDRKPDVLNFTGHYSALAVIAFGKLEIGEQEFVDAQVQASGVAGFGRDDYAVGCGGTRAGKSSEASP